MFRKVLYTPYVNNNNDRDDREREGSRRWGRNDKVVKQQEWGVHRKVVEQMIIEDSLCLVGDEKKLDEKDELCLISVLWEADRL